MKDIGKRGRFMPFWILFGIMGVLLIGSQITPLRIVLDDSFERIEDAAIANDNPKLSCTSEEASGIMKATCFSLGGFMVIFILYVLYSWITAMVNGAKKNGPVFAPRLRKMQAALEE